MEQIVYGGVTLDVIVTQRFHRASTRDEVNNLLVTKWEIEAQCNFQPALMSYALQDPLPALPIAMPGKLPGETDLAILASLLQPRQQLTVTAGGSVVLDTPSMNPASGGRYAADAANGPTATFVSVPKMVGIRHWIVHIRFEATTCSCTASSSMVLSNTWTTTFDIDELFYPTRIVAGKAVLRTDIMRAQHLTADNFRPDFFFPLDVNYVRENVNVKLSEDGATLLWSFQDVGRCYNVAPNSPIRKVEIFRSTFSKAGMASLAQRQIAEAGATETIESQDVYGTVTRGPGMVFRFAKQNMPQYYLNIRCDIWGDRNSLNSAITALSLGICLNQGIASGLPMAITTAEVICRQELTNRFVSSEITWRWSNEFSMPSPLVDLGAVTLPPVVNTPGSLGPIYLLNSLFLDYSSIYGRIVQPTAPIAITQAFWVGPGDVQMSATNNFVVGSSVVITGMTPAGYNGTYTITAASGTGFVYSLASNPGPATVFGTVLLQAGSVRTEILFQRDGLNPAPLSNCKSTLIETLVVQALLSPCQAVPPAASLTLNS
jgi:hypothetical protein